MPSRGQGTDFDPFGLGQTPVYASPSSNHHNGAHHHGTPPPPRSQTSRSLTPPPSFERRSGRNNSNTSNDNDKHRSNSDGSGIGIFRLGGGGGGGNGRRSNTTNKSRSLTPPRRNKTIDSGCSSNKSNNNKMTQYLGMGTACLVPEELRLGSFAAGVGTAFATAGQAQRQLADPDDNDQGGGTGLEAELICPPQMMVSGISLDPDLLASYQLDDLDDNGDDNGAAPMNDNLTRYGGEDYGHHRFDRRPTEEELGFEVSFSDLIKSGGLGESSRSFSPRMAINASNNEVFTDAVIPFQHSIPLRGYLHSELTEHDEAFRHATMVCGTCWQSLVSQHVRFPTLWYWTETETGRDGSQQQQQQRTSGKSQPKAFHFDSTTTTTTNDLYGRPPLGSSDPWHCPWQYMTNNTIKRHPLLLQMIPTSKSPGVVLLHVVVRSYTTIKSYRGHHDDHVVCTLQDLVVGSYHPMHHHQTTHIGDDNDQRSNIRHVWLTYRSRSEDSNEISELGNTLIAATGTSLLTTKSSSSRSSNGSSSRNHLASTNPFLLSSTTTTIADDPKRHRMMIHRHSQQQQQSKRQHDRSIHNDNLRSIFGDRPPLVTTMVSEQELIHLVDGATRYRMPIAIALLEQYVLMKKK